MKLRRSWEAMKGRKIPQLNLDEDLAYVLGVLGPGDGFRFRDGVGLEVVDKEFAEEFKTRIERATGLRCRIKLFGPRKITQSPTYRVALFSCRFRDFLTSFGVAFEEKTWRVPLTVKRAPNNVKTAYLRGVFDSQASVNKSICVEVMNRKGLREIQKMLEDFHMRTYLTTRAKRRGMYKLYITGRKSLEEFDSKIGFTVERKSEKLKKWLQRCPCERTPTRKVDEIIPKMIQLRELGFSYEKIARSLGVNDATVWARLRNIKTEDKNNMKATSTGRIWKLAYSRGRGIPCQTREADHRKLPTERKEAAGPQGRIKALQEMWGLRDPHEVR